MSCVLWVVRKQPAASRQLWVTSCELWENSQQPVTVTVAVGSRSYQYPVPRTSYPVPRTSYLCAFAWTRLFTCLGLTSSLLLGKPKRAPLKTEREFLGIALCDEIPAFAGMTKERDASAKKQPWWVVSYDKIRIMWTMCQKITLFLKAGWMILN